MITRELLEELLDDEAKNPYKTKEDHQIKALTLLRERIPYDKCPCIICAAEHDIIYLCDIDIVLPYISDEDAEILADCNLHINDDNDCLAMFA